MKPVALIGAASGWGAGFRHTEDGPKALRDLGLAQWLGAQWTAMVAPEHSWREKPEWQGRATWDLVQRHAAALADAVEHAMAIGRFPVVIGGDHAIAMGTWAGVARQVPGDLGLLWLDAHLDAHTAETTPSLNAHGMGAAALLGYGHAPFRALAGGSLRPENLCYVGVRSYEGEEMALLRRLGVRITLMTEVLERGIDRVLAEAVAHITRNTAGFGITIDLDGFDPQDAPGVGLKTAPGLRGAPTVAALAKLAGHPALRAVEVVEYIPELDEGLRTAHLVRDLLAALLVPQGATALMEL